MSERTEKETKVYGIFQRIAGRYDRSNAFISLGLQKRWKKMLTDKVIRSLPEGAKVLDVCCGTGDISLMLADAGRDIQVTGLDFSPAMLREAEHRRKHRKNVRFLRGNALDLPFGDACFDAAVISFGLRNTADYEKTVQEMKRVVRRGGRVYCLESLVPENRVIKPFYRLYFRQVMPFLGGGKSFRREYQWLYESTRDFLGRRDLEALFGGAGLSDIRAKSRMFGACVLVSGRR